MQFSEFSRGKSVRQLVYETLYRAICAGELKAGTRLVEEELAGKMHESAGLPSAKRSDGWNRRD